MKTGLGLKVHSPNIKDRNGQVLTQTKGIANRWQEYCCSLYNHELKVDNQTLNMLWPKLQDDGNEPHILESKVRAAINKLKLRKAPGVDCIEGETSSNMVVSQ